MTTEQYLLVAISTLAGALGFLWRRVDANATKCEQDRAKLWQDREVLWARLVEQNGHACTAKECGSRMQIPLGDKPKGVGE